ncbi:AraC family transcriptional regulator [Polyangium sorediatum]|uniref:AraC family transcriptional regulator ligand-binding domain-containing protein n=1 Tax=Polyangium sorediatum TaxID=889274 RepID=A0ABT6NSX3_9BACT|nr:AraC family transcriptional regulator [Polyangium sorediatum]MDI1431403.1 AraC family transcriptional regulator ligand-binding domain-containing protein [Polyangium sorediatum]
MDSPRGSMTLPLALAIVEAAAARGVARGSLLETLGVEAHDLSRTDLRVPLDRIFATWELAMRTTRDPGLPIAVGKLASVSRFGLLGLACYTSPTARHAIECAVRYHELINDSGRWSTAPSFGGATVLWERDGERTLGQRVANEQALASFVTILREVVGADAAISDVCLRSSKPSRTSAHEEHFRAPIRWDASTWSLRLPERLLDQRPRGADPVLTQYFARETQAALARLAVPAGIARDVASAILHLLPGGIPTLEKVAAGLGMSERTARRRLRAESTSYEAIVAAVQQSQARALLEAGLSVREVAFATGFSEPSAFSRAFRRWTGESPSSLRPRVSRVGL